MQYISAAIFTLMLSGALACYTFCGQEYEESLSALIIFQQVNEYYSKSYNAIYNDLTCLEIDSSDEFYIQRQNMLSELDLAYQTFCSQYTTFYTEFELEYNKISALTTLSEIERQQQIAALLNTYNSKFESYISSYISAYQYCTSFYSSYTKTEYSSSYFSSSSFSSYTSSSTVVQESSSVVGTTSGNVINC